MRFLAPGFAPALVGHADRVEKFVMHQPDGRFMQEVFAPTNRIGDTVGLKWSPEGVETHGDQFETERVVFVPKCLPHGQVVTTASPRRPRDEQYLAAVHRRELERVAIRVR